ncbi:MAG: zinc-dependent peptidase, partial [Burkholderiales bacterium]
MFGKLFNWLRGPQENVLLPDELWHDTIAGLPFLACLNSEEQRRLRALCQDFLGEKEFSTAGGLELSDAISVSIA